MKNKIALFLFSSIFSIPLYGQVEKSIKLQMGNVNTLSHYYKAVTNSFSGGISFQYCFQKQNFVVDVGANYTPIALANKKFICMLDTWLCDLPKKVGTTYELFDISLNVGKKYEFARRDRLSFFVKGGYSVGRIVGTKNQVISSKNEKEINHTNLQGLHKTVHFAGCRFELMYKLNNVWGISLGTSYRLTNIYDMQYGYISSFINQISITKIIANKK